MHKISTLKNGLTLITVDLPYLDSVTTMIAVGAGSRYETKNINGISHFLEHMFFKGTKKYPATEIISNLLDGMGALSNAATSKEYTYFWIKSSTKNLEISNDILSSLLKEPLLAESEIEKEKGVIIEEIRMIKDDPMHLIWFLYEQLQFGDQPLGRNLIGDEQIIESLKHEDFIKYMGSLYSPKNMALVIVGKLPNDIEDLSKKYFLNLPKRSSYRFEPYKREKQTKFKINIFYKKTDQAHLVLGVEGYNRHDEKRYAARILGIILGEGMSSRLFTEIREKRGWAYRVFADHDCYIDTGLFVTYAGLKLDKTEEGLKVIKAELLKMTEKKVSEKELRKAKEMERGRLAIRKESTNFLAEYFGVNFVLGREIENFEEYLKKIEAVTAEDIQVVAKELFQQSKFNLQIIGPFKNPIPFEKILNS